MHNSLNYESKNLSVIHLQKVDVEDWLTKVLRPTWHKINHFGDALPSQSLGQYRRNKGKERNNIMIYANPKSTHTTC